MVARGIDEETKGLMPEPTCDLPATLAYGEIITEANPKLVDIDVARQVSRVQNS